MSYVGSIIFQISRLPAKSEGRHHSSLCHITFDDLMAPDLAMLDVTPFWTSSGRKAIFHFTSQLLATVQCRLWVAIFSNKGVRITGHCTLLYLQCLGDGVLPVRTEGINSFLACFVQFCPVSYLEFESDGVEYCC